MKNENAQLLGTILSDIIRQHGLDKKIRAHAIPQHWEEIVGQNAAKVTKVKKLEHGTLIIEVGAPVWRTELMMRRDEIRKKLNEKLGAEMIKEIVLR